MFQSDKTSPDEKSAKLIKKFEAEITRLKDISQVKDEFIRITSHELRTPLDAIRGNLFMILDGEVGEIPERAKEYLEDVLLGADRLTNIINDILDVSRVETNRMKFTLEDIDLNKLFETIEDEYISTFKKKQISLSVEAPEKLPLVYSDHSKIFLILSDFIGNALKFTPDKKEGVITIRANVEDDFVAISVHDTGIGIAPENIKKLFKRFSQIETNIAGIPKGTGLGLYIVKKISEKLGIKVHAESEGLGKGATFSIHVPRSDSKQADALKRFHAKLSKEPVEALIGRDKIFNYSR